MTRGHTRFASDAAMATRHQIDCLQRGESCDSQPGTAVAEGHKNRSRRPRIQQIEEDYPRSRKTTVFRSMNGIPLAERLSQEIMTRAQ